MIGKKSNNPDDDFDFDMGDDFFDLGDPFGSSPETKPPKGIKGYLKNVGKSVKNIGVKLGKNYLPDVDYLIQDLKEDDDVNPKTKWTMARVKKEAKGYANTAADIAKDMAKDVKNGIKTGYFFKSEEDSFGDLDFGDSFGLDGGDSGLEEIADSGFGNSVAPDASENGDVNLISSSDSVESYNVKSAKAQTIASLRMHDDTINATLGATQAHIKAESSLFNQSLLVESEHHRQKMIVMKNIASNVGKIIQQNNVSIKAQMEYSLKSLAFAQDTAAMLKEVRDIQWKAYTPKEKDDQSKSKYKTIFGNGFNKKEWFKNFKSKTSSNFGGGIFDMVGMVKDMLGGNEDLGLSPASLVKGLIGDQIFSSVADALIPSTLRTNLDRLNTGIAGLPIAMNNMLGNIAENGFKEDGLVRKLLDKVPLPQGFKNTILNQGQNFASYAHVEEQTKTNTGKYNLTPEEADRVHPFDGLAHYTLVNTIPKLLARIDAGVNNREEVTMDPSKGQLVTVSSIQRKVKQDQENALTYSEGYSYASDATKDRFTLANTGYAPVNISDKRKGPKPDTEYFIRDKETNQFKSVGNVKEFDPTVDYFVKRETTKNDEIIKKMNLSDEQINQLNKNMMKNIYTSGVNLTEGNRKEFLRTTDKDGKYDPSNLNLKLQRNLLDGTGIDDLTDEQKNAIMATFMGGLDDFSKDENWMRFTQGRAKYIGNLNSTNLDNENKYGRMGMHLAFNSATNDTQNQTNIKNIRKKMELVSKRMEEQRKLNPKEYLNSKIYKSAQTDYLKLSEQLKEAQQYNDGAVTEIINAPKTPKLGNLDSKYDQEKEWEIEELSDKSNNGILNNIYKLLLDGVIVYPRDKMSDEVSKRYGTRNEVIDKLKEEKKSKLEAEKQEQENAKLESQLDAERRLQYRQDQLDSYKIDPWLVSVAKKYNIPFFSKLVLKSNDVMNKITNEGSTFLADNLEHYAYGADISGTKTQETNDNIKSKFNKTVNKAKGEKEKLKKIAEEEGVVNAIKAAASDAKNSQPIQKVSKVVKSTGEKAKDIVESAKTRVGQVAEATKNEGVIGGIKEVYNQSKESISNVVNNIKNSQAYNTINKYITEESGNLENILQDKAKTNKLVNNMLKQRDITKAKADEIKKTIKEQGPVEGIKLLEKVIVESKPVQGTMKVVKSTGEKAKDIVESASESKLGQKIKNSTIGTYTGAAIRISEKALGKAKSALGSTLSKIKVGDTTLDQAIAGIPNSELVTKLEAAKDPVDKATILAKYSGDELDSFKDSINKFLDSQAKQGKKRRGILKGIDTILHGKKHAEEKYGELEKANITPAEDKTKSVQASGEERREGSLKDQILDKKEAEEKKREEEKNSHLSSIAIMLSNLFNKGFKLDKKTLDEIDESNQNAADKMSDAVENNSNKEASTWLGKIGDFVEKSPLGNTKFGKAIGSGLQKADGVISKVKGSKVGKSVGSKVGKSKLVTKVGSGIASALGGKSAVRAFNKFGIRGLSKNLSKNIAKNGLKTFTKNAVKGTAKGGAKLVGKGVGKATVGTLKGAGKLVKGATSMESHIWNTLKKAKNVGTKVGKVAGKTVGGALKGAKTVGGSALKTIGDAGKAHGGLVKKFIELLEKAGTAIFKNPKFAGGKTFFKTAFNAIKTNIGKIAGKIASKISSAVAFLGTVWGAVAKFAAGFTLGMTNTKKTLEIGKDMKPTAAMRLICGVAQGLDMMLSGIPTLICKLIFKTKNFAAWLYSKVGSKAEKAALERYKKYCEMKAVIYGVKDSSSLIAYENRNVVDKAGRKLLNIVTLGIAKNNDERDASMLGFKSVKIFKYWKEKKYEPLENLRKEVAENYGGLKVVEKTEKFTADKDNNGEIDENEKEKAEKEQKAIENQQAFRVDFLKQARSWVIKNKLAWLNSECTLENFKKRTGEAAEGIKTKKQKAKELGKKIGGGIKKAAPYLIGGALGGSLGVAAVAAFKNRKKIAEKGKAVVQDIKAGAIKAGGAIGRFGKKVGGAIAEGAKKFGKSVANGAKNFAAAMGNAGNAIKNGIKAVLDFAGKFIKNKAVQRVKGIVAVVNVIKTVCKALTSMATKDPSFAKKLKSQLVIFTVALPMTITKAVGAFMAGRLNPGKYLGFDVDQKTDKLRLIGSIIAVIKSILPSADEACSQILGKTLKKVVFDEVMNDSAKANKDTFLEQKAKILGLEVPNMVEYENKLNQDNFGKKAVNFLKNVFGGGADRTDAKLCGFKSLKVFKFWREEKYDPLRNLEESVSRKFGDIDDLRSETPKDPELQKKFRAAYLKEARNYVKERGLEWLTYKTTEKELKEREKNKTLYLKSDKQYKKESSAAEESKNPFKKLQNFFFSKNADNRGNAKQSYQNKNTKYYPYSEIDAADTKAMEETLKKEYNYDKKAMGVMQQASASIKSFWKSISPNFYGDQAPAKVSADPKVVGDQAYYDKGGPEMSTGQGLVTKVRDRFIKSGSNDFSLPQLTNKGIKNVTNMARTAGKNLKNKLKLDDDGYGLNENKINRAKVMNSIVNDFAKNFGKELNKRLDILEEMHKESLRHNKVSEEFFVAALRLMQDIASKSGSGDRINSSLDSAINALIH